MTAEAPAAAALDVSDAPKHAMSRRLEVTADRIMDRSPDALVVTLQGGARCIDILWHSVNSMKEKLADLQQQLATSEREREALRELAALEIHHMPGMGYCWFHRSGQAWTGNVSIDLKGANTERRAAIAQGKEQQ